MERSGPRLERRATFAEQDTLDRVLPRQRELDALVGEQAEDRRVDLATLDIAEADSDESVASERKR